MSEAKARSERHFFGVGVGAGVRCWRGGQEHRVIWNLSEGRGSSSPR